MHLVVGLGNPGSARAGNRHNIGFMAADAIARHHSFGPWRNKFRGLIAEGKIGGNKVLLLKPQTYMNLSGESVGEVMRYYNLNVGDLVVLYDEIDLPSGKTRVKTGGGSGGHNGIRSIEKHCGRDFKRIRLGIGHPGDKSRVQSHVLGDFSKAERLRLEPFLQAVADNIGLVLAGQDSSFMNRLSLLAQSEKSAEGSVTDRSRTVSGVSSAIRQGPLAGMLARLFGQRKD